MLLAEDPEIDMLCICTDWSTHTDIAVKAMTCGKHVAIEVPAALTVADCWRLVDTAEETRRHCFMLENCCFDPFALSTLQMKRKGWFGEITHCEGATFTISVPVTVRMRMPEASITDGSRVIAGVMSAIRILHMASAL